MTNEPLQTVVVDTDVFSFIFGRGPRSARYLAYLDGKLAAISFQTVAELLKGAYINEWGERRLNELQEEMRRYVVIPYHADMADIWARIIARRRRMGHELAPADAWIAATAIWARSPVVTHNHRDFSGLDELIVVNYPDPPTA